nr:hypothetical protein Iba_chr08aCG12150 [Ipomoea batatas]
MTLKTEATMRLSRQGQPPRWLASEVSQWVGLRERPRRNLIADVFDIYFGEGSNSTGVPTRWLSVNRGTKMNFTYKISEFPYLGLTLAR